MKKLVRKHWLMMLLLLMMLLGTDSASAAKKLTVTSPAGSKKIVYVAVKKKVSLTTSVAVTSKSKKKKIAKVNKKIITGVKPGKTTVTLWSKGKHKKKKTIRVQVMKKAVKKVKLNQSKKELALGETYQLKSIVTPKKNTFKTVRFTSSNKTVVTVSKKGVIKGVSPGTATVTAMALDGSKKKAKCNVTISKDVKGNGSGTHDNGSNTKGSDVDDGTGTVAKDATSITSVVYQKNNDFQTLKVTLNKPMKLETSDFQYLLNEDQDIELNCRSVQVEQAYTEDDVHYTLFMENYFRMGYGEFGMISIPKLNGIKKMVVDDSACYNRDHDFTRTLADYVVGGSIEPGNSMDKILRTYTTVSSVENSVPGVTAKIEDNGRLIVFNGTNKSTKIEYMQYTMKNIFGEEKTFSHPIYPYALVEEGIVMRDNFYMRAGVDESSFLFKNYCSEPYEAEAIGLPEGLKLQPWAHSDSDWLIVNYGGFRAGDYSFTLKLTSESNTVMKNVVIHLSEGERPTNTMVTGKITDLSGNLIDETIDTPKLFMTEVGSDGFIDLKETGKYEEIDVDDKGEFSFQRCKVCTDNLSGKAIALSSI